MSTETANNACPASRSLPTRMATNSTTTTSRADSLWDKALESLSAEEKQLFDFRQDNKLKILGDVQHAAEEKKRICLEKRWKYKRKDGKVIIIRDQLDKIIRWVDVFKSVGDIAVQYDPTHVSLPWAAVRFFLQVAVNDSQTFGFMVEGIERVSKIISWSNSLEKLYLKQVINTPDESRLQGHLTQALVELYTTILNYVIDMRRYFSSPTASRLAKSVIQSVEFKTDPHIKLLASHQAEVNYYSHLIDALYHRETSDYVVSVHERFGVIESDIRSGRSNVERILRTMAEPITRTAMQIDEFCKQLDGKDRLELLGWLSSVPHLDHHKTIGKDFLHGSCQWLLEDPSFKSWIEESYSSILWLHGIPGSGKTKSVYSVIQHLKNEHPNGIQAPLAHFYCTRDPSDLRRSDPDEIMRSILRQVSWLKSSVREPLASKYKNLKKEAEENGTNLPARLTISESVEAIVELLDENPATIIIDALDECDGTRRYELFEAFDTIITKSSNVVKIFISSRDDQDIHFRLKHSPNIYISARKNGNDIIRFVLSQVDAAIEKRRLLNGNVSHQLKADIIGVLSKDSQGMFRWVSLQIENLCHPQRMKHERDVRSELGKLPRTLKESYDIIYHQIQDSASTSRQVAMSTLKLLLCTKRTLSSDEMLAAFALFRCLDYYVSHSTDSTLSPSNPEFPTDAFKDYAIMYWILHYDTLPDECLTLSDRQKLRQFFSEDAHGKHPFARWDADCKAFVTGDHRQIMFTCEMGHHSIASHYGRQWILNDLARLKEHPWHARNVIRKSALEIAASNCQVEIVRLLMQAEDIDTDEEIQVLNRNSALVAAVKSGHLEVCQLLLQKSVGDLTTAGSTAARKGFSVIMSLLIEKGLNVNQLDSNFLLLATRGSFLETVDVILSAGPPDTTFAMEYAAFNNVGLEVTRRILGARAIDDIRDSDGRNLVRLATEARYLDKLNLFIEKGSDPDNKDNLGRTPLIHAAKYGDLAFLKVLLGTKRVDTNTAQLNGQTAFMLVANSQRNTACIELLSRAPGFNINAKDSKGQTALILTARLQSNPDCIRTILGILGIDVNAKDSQGRTALIVAIEYRRPLEIVQTLLEVQGVDVNAIDNQGRTALMRLTPRHCLKLMRRLLDMPGLDLHLRDNDGRNAVGHLESFGHSHHLALLLENSGIPAEFEGYDNDKLWPRGCHCQDLEADQPCVSSRCSTDPPLFHLRGESYRSRSQH